MTFVNTFESTFGQKPPALLSALAAWQEKEEAFIGADLELRVETPEELQRAWFLDAEAAGRLLVFCHDGMDSNYALWRTAGEPLDQAPVVSLSSEGDGPAVLARNLHEFLALAGTGYACVGLREWELSGARKADPQEVAPAFVSFLKGHAIDVAEAPSEAIAAANEVHAGFSTWLEAHTTPPA